MLRFALHKETKSPLLLQPRVSFGIVPQKCQEALGMYFFFFRELVTKRLSFFLWVKDLVSFKLFQENMQRESSTWTALDCILFFHLKIWLYPCKVATNSKSWFSITIIRLSTRAIVTFTNKYENLSKQNARGKKIQFDFTQDLKWYEGGKKVKYISLEKFLIRTALFFERVSHWDNKGFPF